MKLIANIATGILILLLTGSCKPEAKPSSLHLTKEALVLNKISELKEIASTGDLVVRLNDDLVSERVKYLNEKDKSYSHTGIIVERGGKKTVAHIAPEAGMGDTIQFIPIDRFINPAKHITCALYRYNLNKAEQQNIINAIDSLHKNKVRFDHVYDLETHEQLYCSEMIAKVLEIATNNRIICRQTFIPPNMQNAVQAFFKKEKFSKEIVAERKIITIDNLYLRDDCKPILAFRLKYFPDQLQ